MLNQVQHDRKRGDRARGSKGREYIPYSNFPSTGGRELKGGGYDNDEINETGKYVYTYLLIIFDLLFPKFPLPTSYL